MPNDSFRYCNICERFEDTCICVDLEEVPIPTGLLRTLTEYVEFPEDTQVPETESETVTHYTLNTNVDAIWNSVPQSMYMGEDIYIKSKHERELHLRCDGTCGVIMCIVCMTNLDYYLNF